MSRRYTFRFETLLHLRKQREEEEQRVVASRLRDIRRLEQRQEVLLGRIRDQTDLARNALRKDSVDWDHLKLGRHWLIRLRRGVLEAEAEIAANKALLAQERSNLVEASRNRRILTRLKERQSERFQLEERRREQIETDEMNVRGFAHAVLQREDERW